MKRLRYTVLITFKNHTSNGYKYVRPIREEVKTLKECYQYKDLIDSTVDVASIIDNVTGNLIERLD